MRRCEWPRIGMRLAVALSVVAVGATARAQSSVDNRVLAAEPGSTLLSRIGPDVQFARVTRDSITSPAVDLRRQGDRLRGRVGAQEVDLVLQPGHVAGNLGGRSVSLDVLPRGARHLEIAGRFGNRVVAVAIDPSAVTAELGPCVYRTDYRDGSYRGQVSCGGQAEPVELRFPAVFVARSDVELAALLTAILAR